jgi:hypothetical protein
MKILPSNVNVTNMFLSNASIKSDNKTVNGIENSLINEIKKSLSNSSNDSNLIINNEKLSFGKIKSYNNSNYSNQNYSNNDLKKSSNISSIKNNSTLILVGKSKNNDNINKGSTNSVLNALIDNVSNLNIGNINTVKENNLTKLTEKINSKYQLKLLGNNGKNQTDSLPKIAKSDEYAIFGKKNNSNNQEKGNGILPMKELNIIRNLNKSFVINETNNHNESVESNLTEYGKNTENFDGQNRTEIFDEKINKNNFYIVNTDKVVKNKIPINIGLNQNKLITFNSKIVKSMQDKYSPNNSKSSNNPHSTKFDFAEELKKHYYDMLETVMLNQNQYKSDNTKVISQNEILNGNFSTNDLNGNIDTNIVKHNEVILNSNNREITKHNNINSFNNRSHIFNSGNINYVSNTGIIQSNLYGFTLTSNIHQEMNPLYLKILGLNEKDQGSESIGEHENDE